MVNLGTSRFPLLNFNPTLERMQLHIALMAWFHAPPPSPGCALH